LADRGQEIRKGERAVEERKAKEEQLDQELGVSTFAEFGLEVAQNAQHSEEIGGGKFGSALPKLLSGMRGDISWIAA
jgi:hypothetical protein